MKWLLALVTAAALMTLGFVPQASADFVCSNTFATPMVGGVISDNVLVQGPGAVCYLQGVTVTGDVHVKDGAEFIADGCLPSAACGAVAKGSHLMRNVDADHCADVELWAATRVDGNFHAEHCTGTYSGSQVPHGLGISGFFGTLAFTPAQAHVVVEGNVAISHSSNLAFGITAINGIVGGNATFEDNTLGVLAVDTFRTIFGGALTLQRNTATFAPILSGNVVIKILRCEDNLPAPTDAGSNFFLGHQAGQCAAGVDGFGDGI